MWDVAAIRAGQKLMKLADRNTAKLQNLGTSWACFTSQPRALLSPRRLTAKPLQKPLRLTLHARAVARVPG